jgi:hypothetical protein
VRRPYITESAINSGCGVVQGSADNKIAVSTDGTGAFIGVYAFKDDEAKKAGDTVGIAITGVVKVLAGGVVTAGTKATLKSDDSGAFVNVSGDAGQVTTCGTFLESGAAGEYVDMIVERGSVTVPAAE